MKFCKILLGPVYLALCCTSLAQSTNASLTGFVDDPSKAVIPRVSVTAINTETGEKAQTLTNRTGQYVLPALPPGTYRIEVDKQGFKGIIEAGLVLHVQDVVQMNFHMVVGSMSETVTVNANELNVNTTDGSVSTIVDRKLLQEIPLNGQTLQTLLMLTPGVQFTEGGAGNSQGQFSSNGMRTDGNYFTVDGAAANLSTDTVGNGLGEAAAGSAGGFNALGGTNGLVSVDAIEEFRVQTSSFAPEFGRTPGAQVGIVTRSGSNHWNGSLFDYLRNEAFDANDWFGDYNGIPKARERQNDFGGVFGGPIAKDHTFGFFSYEGMRLSQPSEAESAVPDAAARSNASAALKPFLNAFPVPSQSATLLGDDIVQYNAAVSSPASIDSYSLRVDQMFGGKFRLFARYAYSPSSVSTTGSVGYLYGAPPNNIYKSAITTNTFTVGLDANLSGAINNELRLNYSNLKSHSQQELTSFGGATPISSSELAQIYPSGVNVSTAQLGFSLDDGSGFTLGQAGLNEQRQFGLNDNISITKGSHALKFGVDFRLLEPLQVAGPYYLSLEFSGINDPTVGVNSGNVEGAYIASYANISLRSHNLSLYAQDTWHATPKLTLTYGVRWDLNPAPHGNSLANDPLVVSGLDDPATMALAPLGTPFYATTYTNFAPRIGAAYKLFDRPGFGTVLRGGFGMFYDIGSGSLGSYSLGYPFYADNYYSDVPYPMTAQQLVPPTIDLSAVPLGGLVVAEPNLSLPRTYQWNVAAEQSLGSHQSITFTYLGTLGKDLIRNYYLSNPNPTFSGVEVSNNQGISNYQALQVQYRRQVSHGLQALASYSWAHSIDNASNDYSGYSPTPLFHDNLSIDRGNSDFDVRHSVNAALTYDIPSPRGGIERIIAGGWSVQNLVTARTSFPVDLNFFTDGMTSGPYAFSARPNVVPGEPLYLYGSKYPGGKAFNPAAFVSAAAGMQGDLGRNTLRGFGVWQDNFAVHRKFALTDKVSLTFRTEWFNVLNHPNFADPLGFFPPSYPEFGVATQTVANAAGFNGLSSLYGVGGSRSGQFGLKLQF